MKLWIDDVRPAPEGYIWVKSVNEAKKVIEHYKDFCSEINMLGDRTIYYQKDVARYVRYLLGEIPFDIDDIIDIDHDAGEYAKDGGDYIKLLDWIREKDYEFEFHIHSMNPVGVENMRRIIQRNGWKEI